MFQAIFYNPRDWTQLPCNKLMDTVKIFGHFTVAINGAFHTTLGSTDVGFALLKIMFTLTNFVCQHTVNGWPWKRYMKTLKFPNIACKQTKDLEKQWCLS